VCGAATTTKVKQQTPRTSVARVHIVQARRAEEADAADQQTGLGNQTGDAGKEPRHDDKLIGSLRCVVVCMVLLLLLLRLSSVAACLLLFCFARSVFYENGHFVYSKF
jgi:hypothetical protein